ncbi:GAF and ANTAR domain-containing protein [Rathayibacter soli]|uniref:GAF and ANTAR domain-containing protein n=1 Tax=Rathayibacter soli TaxID=3144168 RepID=UPI0027E3DB09|nr:GAF and ANTAR domain-containing protein [Glaciibacter superstes]
MSAADREGRLAGVFVTLADTLVAEYDVVDLLHTLVEECISLFDAAAAGLVLADANGRLQLMASTSERSRVVEAHQLNVGDGPCVACFSSGQIVVIEDLMAVDAQWSTFRTTALDQGFRSVHAVPLRLRDQTIGALNLFRDQPGVLNAEDAAAARALADVATIGILQERAIRERTLVTEQLQIALDSRVVIEQAKGVVAQTSGVPMDEAFARLRDYARRHNQRLHEVAENVISRALNI